MVKRIIVGAGVLTLLAVFLFGRDAASYVGTTAGWVKNSVKDSVPIEFEIDRARKMVGDLVPDIRKNMHVIAREEVEIERLDKQIAEAEQRLDKDRGELLTLKNALSSGGHKIHLAGRTYSGDEVRTDLGNRFERFKTANATLENLQHIKHARQRSLNAARQKLEGMMAAKRQLEVQVENLEARLKMVEVAQTTSEINVDDSRLGRAKELISDLHARLAVAEKLANADQHYHDEIPLDQPVGVDIVDQVTEYFSESTDQTVRVAESH